MLDRSPAGELLRLDDGNQYDRDPPVAPALRYAQYLARRVGHPPHPLGVAPALGPADLVVLGPVDLRVVPPAGQVVIASGTIGVVILPCLLAHCTLPRSADLHTYRPGGSWRRGGSLYDLFVADFWTRPDPHGISACCAPRLLSGWQPALPLWQSPGRIASSTARRRPLCWSPTRISSPRWRLCYRWPAASFP